jgi:type VI protein secretion system component VasK
MFKDRVLAKKYEDYTALRLLVAVALISVYIFLITLIVVIIPYFFWEFVAQLWGYVLQFNPGEWVLFIGVLMLITIGVIYLGFVLWNHAVFAVLKRVKRIEEEYEIEEEIKKEELKAADEETLQTIYQKQTGKEAIYRGKETKGYTAWKKKMLS